MNKGYKFKRTASLVKLQRVLELLREPLTRAELADAMHVRSSTAGAYLTYLMDEQDKRIHIASWDKGISCNHSARYLVGNLPDRRRPNRETAKRKSRRYRQRKQPVAHDYQALSAINFGASV